MRLLYFALFCPLAGTAALATSVVVDNLGSLGSGDSVAYGINSSGMTVGWSANQNGVMTAFSANGGGSPFAFSATSPMESYAYGINSSGAATGVFYQDGQARGAVWGRDGQLTDLGAGTFGTAINNSGAVAGGNGQAFVYSNGLMRQLGNLPGGNWSSAYGINNAGAVVGYGNIGSGVYRGFFWTGTTMIAIGTLGGSSSYAMDVNDNGVIVGDASTRSGYLHAFLSAGGTMQDLGTLGGTSSYGYAVNNRGVAAGYSTTRDGSTHAFVYENGQMVDLNSLLSPGSGWVLVQAYGINDQDQIVGTGIWNGRQQAFRLDLNDLNPQTSSAVPEPGSWVLLAFAGLLTCVSIWLRRRSRAAAGQNSADSLDRI